MTITSEVSRVSFVGDDATVAFDTTPIKFNESTELTVRERVVATGSESVKVLGVDYTVTGGGRPIATGTVTFTVAPATGVNVVITRTTAATQQSDYVNDSALSLETVETDLDLAAARSSDDRRLVERSLRVPESDDPSISTDLPDSVARIASDYLGTDGSGEFVMLDAPTGTTALSAYGASLGTSADASGARTLLEVERSESGTIAARVAASTFGAGYYYATDLEQPFYSDGTSWFPIGIGEFANASIPAAAAANAGARYLDNERLEIRRSNGTANVLLRTLPPGHITGFRSNGSLPAQDLDISSGRARGGTAADQDIANVIWDDSGVPFNKLLNPSGWTAGTGNGGRPAADALAADKWHALFALTQDDGSRDFGFDDDADATNLLADAAVVAAGHDYYKRLKWVQETAAGTGTIREYLEEGDEFWPDNPLSVTIASADYTTQASLDLSAILPPGPDVACTVLARATASTLAADYFLIFGRTGQTLPVPTTNIPGASGAGNFQAFDSAATAETGANWVVLYPDANQTIQIRAAGDTSVELQFTLYHWRDTRGRHAS